METAPNFKEQIPELRFAHLAPDTWKKLSEIERTGWVKRGVANPETVQAHTISLRKLAATFPDLSNEDKRDLLDMLEIHDWPEAIHGDEVIIANNPDELQQLNENKFENEKAALENICAKLGEKGGEIMDLWLRFETSDDATASLARQLDKYQAVEKALEYEKAQNIPLFREFLESSKAKISHPTLLQMMQRLESKAG